MEIETSELHGINPQSDLRSDMLIRNYRVALPVSATAGASEKSYSSATQTFLQHQGVVGSRGDGTG